ncbi:MAG: glycosyltransferase family 2 protein [Candidatus Heimdallarchaeota archaeon]
MTIASAGNPSVSIVLSTYQSRNLIRACIDSLQALDYPRVEIIVVDAGSTDGTPELIENEYKDVRLVRREKIGIGEANNIGIRLARGDLIAFDFNTDEIAKPSWLSELVKALAKDKTIGVVGGLRRLHGTDMVDDAGFKLSPFGYTTKLDRNRSLETLDPTPRIVDAVGAPLARREIFRRVGLCEEIYYLYGEDIDFCLRVQKAGYKVICVPQAITDHCVSFTVGLGPRYFYYLRRAQIAFCLLNYSGIRLFLSYSWWLIFQTLIDVLMVVPPIRKLARILKLEFLARRGTRENIKAILRATSWNILNFRAVIQRRQQRNLLLERKTGR